jgi:hypothetical protein
MEIRIFDFLDYSAFYLLGLIDEFQAPYIPNQKPANY